MKIQEEKLTKKADLNNIYIEYINGRSRRYSFLNNHKVQDASKIVIMKDTSEPLDKTQYLTDLTRIFANITQAISLLLIARN